MQSPDRVVKGLIMEMTKKTKIMIGIAGALLVVVVIVYAVYYGGDGPGDKATAEGLVKPNATQATPQKK